jgi:general secretion pathway protein G
VKTGKMEMKKRNVGFTILELLIVMALIAIVGGILYSTVLGADDKGKAKAAALQISSLGQALEMYKLDVGRYPNSAEGLQALIAAPAGAQNWNGPYLTRDKVVPKDPWNSELRYTAPAQSSAYEIVSLGADQKEGGEGVNRDISNISK